MQIDIFTWASSIPRSLYDDKTAMYSLLLGEWSGALRASHGYRMPGPLHLKVMEFGYIDDMSLQEVIVETEPSPLWTYVVVRVTGPVVRP